jgi:hypothetical protein
VVVLSPGVFDRFYDPEYNPKDDWVRREIACAIAERKNIVPIILDGFQWPKNPLPPDVEDLARKNGKKYWKFNWKNKKPIPFCIIRTQSYATEMLLPQQCMKNCCPPEFKKLLAQATA